MAVELRRHRGPRPNAASIERSCRAAAREVYGWSNGPGDRYAWHEHAYAKLLFCVSGSIDFVLEDGRAFNLRPGDALVLPPRTPHSALVGPQGCTCVEGQLPPG